MNYLQFYSSFKELPYDLSPNDIDLLLAVADENPNGRISWKEFIPVGIDAIKVFLYRNKMVAKMVSKGKQVGGPLDAETTSLIYEEFTKFSTNYIFRKFRKIDT